ncbi:MAG: hypothetical protein EBQ57_04795 [Actinobacteria bacterium]|nr:hypothetical protein [Actinomycetota bacterium]
MTLEHDVCGEGVLAAGDAASTCITVRTMRRRFDRANGPTRARSSTDQATGLLPSSGVAVCTSDIHCGYASSSRT